MGVKGFIQKKFAGKIKYQNFWNKLYNMSLIGMNIGGGSEFEDSGEESALKYLIQNVFSNSSPIIFDVGANIGGYTLDVLKHIPSARVHCFEPANETYNSLCKNITDDNVIKNHFGISDQQTEGVLFYDKENSGLASLYNRQLDYYHIEMSKSEQVSLNTLDMYCLENKIDCIDLLKMDIEGNEYKALKGATSLLSEKKIKSIQLEFGGCNIDSRTYFRDYWNLLNKDFRVYRIVKDGLAEITKYDEKLEIFTCTNYLFILRKSKC